MSRNSLPDWLPAFLKFYARADLPTVRDAWNAFCNSLTDPTQAPSLWQVRRAVRNVETLMNEVA